MNTTSDHDAGLPVPMIDVCAEIEPAMSMALRPWTPRDADALSRAWHDPEIARWNRVPPDPSVDFARRWITGTTSQSEASTGIDVVAVGDDDIVRGEIGLQIDPVRGVGEVGFWLATEHRRVGLGAGLLTLAQRLAARLELVGIVALTDAENHAAVGLLERLGWNEVPTKSDRRAFALRVGSAPH